MINLIHSDISVCISLCISMTLSALCDSFVMNQSILLPEVADSIDKSLSTRGVFYPEMSVSFCENNAVWQLVDGRWMGTQPLNDPIQRDLDQRFVCRIPMKSLTQTKTGKLQWFKFRKWEWKYRCPETHDYGPTGREHIDEFDWLRMYRYPSSPNERLCLMAFLKPINLTNHFEKLIAMNMKHDQEYQEPFASVPRKNSQTAPKTAMELNPSKAIIVVPPELDNAMNVYNSFCRRWKRNLPEVLPVDDSTRDLCQSVFDGKIRVLSVVAMPLEEEHTISGICCCMVVTGSTDDGRWFYTSIVPKSTSEYSRDIQSVESGREITIFLRETNSYRSFE